MSDYTKTMVQYIGLNHRIADRISSKILVPREWREEATELEEKLQDLSQQLDHAHATAQANDHYAIYEGPASEQVDGPS